MSDIVERLRRTQEWVAFPHIPICVEAAAEIERLRAGWKLALQRMEKLEAKLAAERERCANLVGVYLGYDGQAGACAAAIRRGEP